MSKITIGAVGTGFAATTKLNQDLQKIEDEFNNKVLYRDNPTGEANQMMNDLDMNSNDILNASTIATDVLTIAGKRVAVAAAEDSVTTVDTIAKLRALEPSSDGEQISLLGHTLKNVGGGLFYADFADSTSTDNNGTVIVTPRGRRWKRADVSVITPEMFGALKNGSFNDGPSFVAAQLAAGTGFVTCAGTYTITSTTAEMARFKLLGKNAIIRGFNGTGFLVSGDIHIEGEVEFTGFEDSSNREDQRTNYTTCAIRIKTGSNLSYLRVGKDVHFNKCRGGIRACSDSNDFLPDTTITVSGKSYFYASSNQTISALKLRCVYSDIELAKGVHRNAIGAGRVVVPLDVYIDGVANNSPFYNNTCKIHAHHLVFDTVVNRTTTGDSTPGNNYECNGIKLAGREIQIDNIIGVDVTGVNADCELIYFKARHWTVSNVVAINCGSQEGCINAKGVEENNVSSTSPFGGNGVLENIFIFFDRYSYNNGGTTVNLSCTGINIAVPYNVSLGDNVQVVGANAGDLVLNCGITDSSNNVSSNAGIRGKIVSRQNIGAFSTRIRGQAKYAKLLVDCADASPTGDFMCIDLLGVDNRGADGDFDLSGSSLKLSSTTTGTVSLIRVEGQDQDIRSIVANNCIWDVTASGATQIPLRISAQGASPEGSVGSLIAKNWSFVNSSFSSPLSVGAYPIDHYDISFEYESTTTSNTNVTAGAFFVPSGEQVKLQADVVAFRTDDTSEAHSAKQTALYRDVSNTPTQIGTTLQTELLGNTSNVGMFYSTSGRAVTVRLNGNASETYKWKIRLSAVTS